MPEKLTRSEVIILRMVGEELGNKDIARRLGRSLNTVQNHLTSAYAKLGTSDRREAALIVARDYPLISQIPATPMAPVGYRSLDEEALGGFAQGVCDSGPSPWILPAPPTRLIRLLGIILVFAALSGLVTGGLVLMAAGGMETLAPSAPPNAVLALETSSISRKP